MSYVGDVPDTKARFGFAYFDVANPTEKGLALARDPASGKLMADLHRFWQGNRALKPALVERLQAEEARNALLAKLDPRMSQVVSMSGYIGNTHLHGPGEVCVQQNCGVLGSVAAPWEAWPLEVVVVFGTAANLGGGVAGYHLGKKYFDSPYIGAVLGWLAGSMAFNAFSYAVQANRPVTPITPTSRP